MVNSPEALANAMRTGEKNPSTRPISPKELVSANICFFMTQSKKSNLRRGFDHVLID